MLLTRKFIANECCLSFHLKKEYGMKVLRNSLLKRLWRLKREKQWGTGENFTLMCFVISPFRQVLLEISKSITIRHACRKHSRYEVFMGNIGQETYNEETTYRPRRRLRVTVDVQKWEFISLTGFVSYSTGHKLQYYMKNTSICYLLLSSHNDSVSLSWLTTECMGRQYACLRLQLVLTLKQRTILSAHFNCRCFLVLITKTDCFLNITDRIIFIIEMNLVSKYLLMMCALFVINSSLLI